VIIVPSAVASHELHGGAREGTTGVHTAAASTPLSTGPLPPNPPVAKLTLDSSAVRAPHSAQARNKKMYARPPIRDPSNQLPDRASRPGIWRI